MKILVLGYSVTAEKRSYVEIAAETFDPAEIQLVKVGFGGLQPHHARYLFPAILAREAPDRVILDQATPAFRKYTSDEAEYAKCLLSVLRLCQEAGLPMGLLDLPRTDVDYTDDWVTRMHAKVAQAAGIARRFVPLSSEYVWDEVHPTDVGRETYARALLDLINDAVAVPSYPATTLSDLPLYDSVAIDPIAPDGYNRRDLSRGGEQTVMVVLRAGEEITIHFDAPCIARGISYLMGPRTGYLEITTDHHNQTTLAYDEFCYYERLGVVSFNPGGKPPGVRATSIRVRQLPDLPDISLRKGEANTDERLGAIGHIFIENQKNG